jgi:hypothetical protein
MRDKELMAAAFLNPSPADFIRGSFADGTRWAGQAA